MKKKRIINCCIVLFVIICGLFLLSGCGGGGGGGGASSSGFSVGDFAGIWNGSYHVGSTNATCSFTINSRGKVMSGYDSVGAQYYSGDFQFANSSTGSFSGVLYATDGRVVTFSGTMNSDKTNVQGTYVMTGQPQGTFNLNRQ